MVQRSEIKRWDKAQGGWYQTYTTVNSAENRAGEPSVKRIVDNCSLSYLRKATRPRLSIFHNANVYTQHLGTQVDRERTNTSNRYIGVRMYTPIVKLTVVVTSPRRNCNAGVNYVPPSWAYIFVSFDHAGQAHIAIMIHQGWHTYLVTCRTDSRGESLCKIRRGDARI